MPVAVGCPTRFMVVTRGLDCRSIGGILHLLSKRQESGRVLLGPFYLMIGSRLSQSLFALA